MISQTSRSLDEIKGGMPQKIAVILTCFNRKQKTIGCLNAVLTQSIYREVQIDFFITDDGQDGTSEALGYMIPGINLLQGNGSLFWNGGMRLAWAQALKG